MDANAVVTRSELEGHAGTSRLKQIAWVIAVAWTVVLCLVLLGDWWRIEANKLEMAASEARAHYNKDVAFRLWATNHGRIYVPVDERTQPDPNMAQVPERDIRTPAGQQLTLINPAGMIRELNRDYGSLYGVTGRIVGFNPLREENAPDPWEADAIRQFQQGSEINVIDSEPYLRLMRPLLMQQGCLLCHAGNGVDAGGVAGGVGVMLPMRPYEERAFRRVMVDAAVLVGVWLVGLIGLWLAFRRLYRDQGQRALMLDELELNERRGREMVRSALDAIVSIDDQGVIREFNPAAERIFGYPRSLAMGHSMARLLIPEELRERHEEGFVRHLSEGGSHILNRRIETAGLRADGNEFPLELTVTRLNLTEGVLFTAYMRDLSDSHKLQRELRRLSAYDTLTGLFNRQEFERRICHLLEQQAAKEVAHALMYVDLDQFKVINDTCGHEAGDALLGQVAEQLQERMRSGDLLARLGGDEFGILLHHCPPEMALQIAQQLLLRIEGLRFEWQGRVHLITASIGLAMAEQPGMQLSDLFSAADSACYLAKEQGRNRVHLFRADDADLAQRRGEMRWVSEIHDAMSEGRLFLYQQLQRGLQGQEEGLSYEILIRMRDREGNFVPPGVFLAAAERFSMMPTIDRWVVRQTFEWLADNPEHVAMLQHCSINLSGHTVTDEGFLGYLRGQLSKYALPTQKICFEITETAAVANLTRATHFIEALRQRGCKFALDDFGSGMSSFAYLKTLPVDFLKIDGAFVRDIMEDEIDFAMVRSINEIGQLMGKQTIAEFVENDAICDRLSGIGVDFAQGYGIAKPAPLSELLALSDHTLAM